LPKASRRYGAAMRQQARGRSAAGAKRRSRRARPSHRRILSARLESPRNRADCAEVARRGLPARCSVSEMRPPTLAPLPNVLTLRLRSWRLVRLRVPNATSPQSLHATHQPRCGQRLYLALALELAMSWPRSCSTFHVREPTHDRKRCGQRRR